MTTQLLLYPNAVDHEIERRLRASEEERRRRLVRPTPALHRWATRLYGARDSVQAPATVGPSRIRAWSGRPPARSRG